MPESARHYDFIDLLKGCGIPVLALFGLAGMDAIAWGRPHAALLVAFVSFLLMLPVVPLLNRYEPWLIGGRLLSAAKTQP